MRKNLSNKQVKIALLALLVGSSCGGDEPGTETGFHENIVGQFDYFVERYQPCSSTGSDGYLCTMNYDETGRLVSEVCPSSLVEREYNDATLTRRITYNFFGELEHLPDRSVTESYVLEAGQVIQVDRTFSQPGSDDSLHTETYTRDELGRTVQIDSVVADSTHTSLELIEYTGDAIEPIKRERVYPSSADSSLEIHQVVDYTWNEMGSLTNILNVVASSNGYENSTQSQLSYDDTGRLVSRAFMSSNLDDEDQFTTFSYECSDDTQ